MDKILKSVRGILATILLSIWIISMAFAVLFLSLFVWIIPLYRWRRAGMKFLLKFPVWWMDINTTILMMGSHYKWDVQGTGELNPNGRYVMISNHRSWFDILVIGSVFNRRLPILKFFMKKELLWSLPFAGAACYVLDYPFLERYTRADIKKNPALKGKDIETTKKACQKFKEFPTTIINFVEGTRFTEQKKQRQNSPFQYLLKPKAGGIAIVINEMRDKLTGIVDVTIHYTVDHFSFWHLVCGNFDKITVRYEMLPVIDEICGDYYSDRKFRVFFQQWLNDLWQKKDNLLKQLNKPHVQ